MTQEPQALLSLNNLGKQYDSGAAAVRNVDLSVMPGEFVTLLGPSGSGKTTILKMIAGFEEPTSGEILIDGQSVVHRPSHERGIGMVFQNYALFPHLTVAENIAFPLDLRRMARPEIEKRVRDALKIMRLPDLGERYPSQLSGGQQQRVALARAVVFEPRLILMDEPLGALDRSLREHLKDEIRRVHQEFGMTVVYVTHDQDEALALSDRIAVMRDGKIEQIATARELYSRPVNRFIARFVGESNLLAFRSTSDGRLALACGIAVDAPGAGGIPPEGWLLVRPETVDLHDGPGQISGTVTAVLYLGEVSRYTVDVGGQSISVKLQNRGGRSFEPGQQVSLTWDGGDTTILTS